MYYFFYGTSFAKVPWVYNSEINSLGWRTRGAAAATATNWMGGFIVTQFTQVGVNNLRWKFYLSKLLSIVSLSSLIFSVRNHMLGLLPHRLLPLPRDLSPNLGGHGRDLHSEPIGVGLRKVRSDSEGASPGLQGCRVASHRRGRGGWSGGKDSWGQQGHSHLPSRTGLINKLGMDNIKQDPSHLCAMKIVPSNRLSEIYKHLLSLRHGLLSDIDLGGCIPNLAAGQCF